jgi:peptide-methionine (S)-S-oxide reductase
MKRLSNLTLAMVAGGLSVALLAALSPAPAKAAFPDPATDEPLAKAPGKQQIVFAGGCFWGVQAVFKHTKGVISSTSGYSGGTVKSPSYEQVSSGRTGHAESVLVVYDPSQVSFGQLLKVFFSVAHDPTELNRQGPDEGTQYRSAIFFSDENQKRLISSYVEQLNNAKVFRHPIVTQVAAFTAFYPAEAYHQDYAELHPSQPYIYINDLPKIEHLKKDLPELYVKK